MSRNTLRSKRRYAVQARQSLASLSFSLPVLFRFCDLGNVDWTGTCSFSALVRFHSTNYVSGNAHSGTICVRVAEVRAN